MKSKTTRLKVNFSYYTITIFLLSVVVQQWMPTIKISNTWPFILLFLYAFTLFAFNILVKYLDARLTYFTNAFMLVNFGKLILFTIIIIVYAMLNRNDAISFTGTFFVYYLLLTSFEIIALLKLK